MLMPLNVNTANYYMVCDCRRYNAYVLRLTTSRALFSLIIWLVFVADITRALIG